MRQRSFRRKALAAGLGSLLGFVVSAPVRPVPTRAVGVIEHAAARNFTPAPNTVVSGAPIAALLLGDEGVGNGTDDYVDVYDARGVEHSGPTTGRASGDLSLVSTPLATMSRGWYAVHWNVVSADGHMAGGDNGAWWVFGVNVKTVAAPLRRIAFRADVALPTLPPTLTTTLDGVRTGSRTLTFAKTSAVVTTVRWKLIRSSTARLVGAEFDWAVGSDRKTKSTYAIGAVPFPGVYRVTVQANVGSVTGVWRSELNVVV